MAMSVVKEGNRFTVEWQEHFTISLPDTPSNRKAMLVFLRSLRDGRGKNSLMTKKPLDKLIMLCYNIG